MNAIPAAIIHNDDGSGAALAADHCRHHARQGQPEDPPASETCRSPPPIAPVRVRQEAFAWSSALPRLVCHRSVSDRCPGEGPRRRLLLRLPSPCTRACVGRHGRPASASPQRAPRLPVGHIPCEGHVLHARTRLNEDLATTVLAVPSFVPLSSACARGLQPSQTFAAPGQQACACGLARCAGGLPGGLPSSPAAGG
jgi:hypothetical protein